MLIYPEISPSVLRKLEEQLSPNRIAATENKEDGTEACVNPAAC